MSTYDPETDTFTVPVVEIPDQKEKPYYCPRHPTVEWDWHKNGRGKSVMGCPECSGVHHTSRELRSHMVQYKDPTYWRERPLTDAEKRNRPLRGS